MSILERVLGAIEDERPPLTVSQINFLWLHVKHAVDMWKWHFCGTQLRAHAGKRKATIWRDELEDLFARDLLVKGFGAANVHTTTASRAMFA